MVSPGTLKGIRMAGGWQQFNVAANTNVLLYDQIAGRSCIVRKIRWRNAQAGQLVLRVGTGAAGAAAIADLVPAITCPGGLDGNILETEIPAQWTQVNQDIVGQVDGVTANDFEAEVEVEVIGA